MCGYHISDEMAKESDGSLLTSFDRRSQYFVEILNANTGYGLYVQSDGFVDRLDDLGKELIEEVGLKQVTVPAVEKRRLRNSKQINL